MRERLAPGPARHACLDAHCPRGRADRIARGEIARPFFEGWIPVRARSPVTTLASPGSIDFHSTLRSERPADEWLGSDEAVRALVQAFGEDAYTDDERPMEHVVGSLLAERGYTVAAAESCTGGLLTSRLTDVPGSSACVQLAVVAYSNQAKIDVLGVPEDPIAAHGAVSEPVARERHGRAHAGHNARHRHHGHCRSGGGTPDKPVARLPSPLKAHGARTSMRAC